MENTFRWSTNYDSGCRLDGTVMSYNGNTLAWVFGGNLT
jgi:hypothetical protein